MAGKQLRLNSLGRYAKKSSTLVLEEHDHCEVPAGCGGVVLRWRNPRAGVPLDIWLYTHSDAGEVKLFFDGMPITTSRLQVSYGAHIFALSISHFPSSKGHLILAAVYDEEKQLHVQYMPPTRKLYHILSKADGSWKYVTAQPENDDWLRPGFDDTTWDGMVAVKPQHGKQEGHMYRLQEMQNLGAEHLGIKGEGGSLWLRKNFMLQDTMQSGDKKEATGCPPVY
jgi:hypothetical protein